MALLLLPVPLVQSLVLHINFVCTTSAVSFSQASNIWFSTLSRYGAYSRNQTIKSFLQFFLFVVTLLRGNIATGMCVGIHTFVLVFAIIVLREIFAMFLGMNRIIARRVGVWFFGRAFCRRRRHGVNWIKGQGSNNY